MDLLQRDLFSGPGGPALTPPADATYQFAAFKTSGTNPGYDVRDVSGRLWSVKLGIEAQSEVTSSRILWAMGFHQPATYYVPRFTLSGAEAGTKLRARFRTDLEPWRAGGEWSWYANPFANTQPFRGLIVAQLVLNAWDLKTSNNRIYEAADPLMQPRRHFMVRDVGASLGQARQFPLFTLLGTRGLQGTKNNIADFEQQGFITRVDGIRVGVRLSGQARRAPELDQSARCDLGVRAARQDPRWTLAGGVPRRPLLRRRQRAVHQED